MKYVAYCSSVKKTTGYVLIKNATNIEETCKHLQFSLFVKPAKAGDSLGIDDIDGLDFIQFG